MATVTTPLPPIEDLVKRSEYLKNMRAHVDEDGRLSHENGVYLLGLVEPLAAQSAKDAERIRALEKERDNARAEASWCAKLLSATRDKFGSIVSDIQDEGDRCYFGSTNDADTLRDIRDQIEAMDWSRIVASGKWEDYISKCAVANANVSTLQAQLAAFRETLEQIDKFDVNANASMVNQVFRLKNIARAALQTTEPKDD